MASVKFNKDSPEFAIFNEFWALLQKYYIPEETDEYWENFVQDYDVFIKKHPESIARGLARFLQTFLENKMKGRC